MAYSDWQDQKDGFKVIDVRNIQGNFFPGLKKQAEELEEGKGLRIIQTFDPIPLYAVMEELGYESYREEVSPTEFHAYFYRRQRQDDSGTIAFRPAALTNFPLIDQELGNVAVNFWDLTWNDEKRFLPYDMRLLLSLANAVGAGRMRQATRELVKFYVAGGDLRALDDLFQQLAWNQGIGFFASEIGPSTLFAAYKAAKQQEKSGRSREEVSRYLMEHFGEKNPDVKVV